jgi:hypothetical protein
MRNDMAKVVTERPRSGHANPSRKWGRRLGKDEYELDDHGPTRASSARHWQYANFKTFSDLIGPLRRYLRKQVGRPWDTVWSEITQTLDSRSLSGQHIFDHILWEVECHAWVGRDGRIYRRRLYGRVRPVEGLYVHPITRLLRCAPERRYRARDSSFVRVQEALKPFGIVVESADDVARYRVDGLRVWERRDRGWFIHTYRRMPAPLIRVVTRSDGIDVPVYGASRLERMATRQANKKEIRDALPLLPFAMA